MTLNEIARLISLDMTAKDLKAADRLGARVRDLADVQQIAMAAVLILSAYVETEKELALEELADRLG